MAQTGPGGSGRHRSLDATIEWSYRLLDDDQRRLLRWLSIFAGGFTPDALEALDGTDNALDTLFALVDKSLVVWDRDANRYRLLETVRTFGRRRLEDAGEAESVADRHLRWCAAFTASVEDAIGTSKQADLHHDRR